MGCISTSLNVVNIAVSCLTLNSLFAMVARNLDIGTLSSSRLELGRTFFGDCFSFVDSAGDSARWFTTSAFVILPSLPEADTSLESNLFSFNSLVVAGPFNFFPPCFAGDSKSGAADTNDSSLTLSPGETIFSSETSEALSNSAISSAL